MKRLLSLVIGCLALCSAIVYAANDDSNNTANDNNTTNKVECCCGQCQCPGECPCPENCENCEYCGKQQYCNDCDGCYRHCDNGDNDCPRYHRRHHRHGGCCRPCN